MRWSPHLQVDDVQSCCWCTGDPLHPQLSLLGPLSRRKDTIQHLLRLLTPLSISSSRFWPGWAGHGTPTSYHSYGGHLLGASLYENLYTLSSTRSTLFFLSVFLLITTGLSYLTSGAAAGIRLILFFAIRYQATEVSGVKGRNGGRRWLLERLAKRSRRSPPMASGWREQERSSAKARI